MCLRILEMSKMNKKVTNALGVYNLLLPALLSQSTFILNLLYLPFFLRPIMFLIVCLAVFVTNHKLPRIVSIHYY